MLIVFHYISLCPRCARARKHLQDLLGTSYEASVTEINLFKRPVTAQRNKIRMVPTIEYGDDQISGILLSHKSIKQFLERNNLLRS